MKYRIAATCLWAVLLGGCSSVNVVKNPADDDNGIRYYRPKPYLMVTPADATGRMVKLEVLYLPDYCEEYSIHPKGKKPPSVQLKDGWNLVGVGGPGAPPEPAPAAAAPAADPIKLPEAVLAAGNVPIGLYESVFDQAGPGKYLKGWRYVGFAPLGGGGPPNGTDAAAMGNAAKGCPGCRVSGSVVQGPLFGLVFFNGAMTFRQLEEIGNNMTCPEYVKPLPPAAVVPTGPEPDIKTIPTTPAPQPEIRTVPTAPAPKLPSPTTSYSPAPRTLPIDGSVTQTFGGTRVAAVKTPPRPAFSVPPAPKGPDPKALAALEAEVFRKLNISPPVTAQSSATSKAPVRSISSPDSPSAVPDLSSPTPLN
jgi:hypothetical protein